MKLAPVGISTYARLGHLGNAVGALAGNPLAKETELFVFSDAPRPGDEAAVESVRDYLRTIDGFASVNIVERKVNGRTFNSRDGIRMLLERYGRLIFLEEDILVAPGFLGFMNQALNAYRYNEAIFSISGYCPPIELPGDYASDVFVLPRFCGWGFGLWRDRFDLIRMKIPRGEYFRFLLNPRQVREFTRGGADMLDMLHAEVHGALDALDVKIFFQQFLLGMNTVYPTRFLASNIGHDGTGLHCVTSSKFDVELQESADYRFTMPNNIEPNRDILRANMIFRDPGLIRKMKFPLKVIRDLLTGWSSRP